MQLVIEWLPYRVQQVVNYIVDRPSPADCEFVQSLLTPALVRLFYTMSPGDRAHAIRVCRSLQERGLSDRKLLQAALLHDVGKAQGVPLPYRIAYTLLERISPALLVRLCEEPVPAWRRPFVTLHRHPEIGAQLAAEAGASADVVAFIRFHQDGDGIPPHLATALTHLQHVDDLH